MTKNRRTIALLLLCVAISPLLYLHFREFATKPFWDGVCYREGISNYLQGKSPLIFNNTVVNDYPPVFFLVGAWLARLLSPALGWKIFLIAHMASVIALPFLLARFYLRGMGTIEAFLLFLLAPLYLMLEILFGGNIASLCYFVALVAAIPGLSRNRWRWFYLVVVMASAIKITFLMLLLLPLFAGSFQMLPSTIATVTTAGVYFAQKIFMPESYREFRAILLQHTLTNRNYGIAPFGATANVLKRLHVMGFFLPGLVQVLFAAGIVLALFWLRGRMDLKDPRWLALILIAVILVNPRMMDYEETVALLPAYFLLATDWRRPSTLVLLAISAAGFFIGHGAIGYLFLFSSAFVVGVRILRDRRPEETLGSQRKPAFV